jgi:hypothetical protein
LSFPWPDVRDEKSIIAVESSKETRAFSSPFNLGVRLINWAKCGVSSCRMRFSKKYIYIKIIESRGIKTGHKVVQEIAGPCKLERCKSGNDRARHG